jgi:hypothetical protein
MPNVAINTQSVAISDAVFSAASIYAYLQVVSSKHWAAYYFLFIGIAAGFGALR